MANQRIDAIHPGEVLLEVYVKPSSPPLSIAQLSKSLGVPRRHISHLIDGKRDITRLMAARLSVVCRTTTEYWLTLQRAYDAQMKKTKVLPPGVSNSGGSAAA